jgi:hypothetical protein
VHEFDEHLEGQRLLFWRERRIHALRVRPDHPLKSSDLVVTVIDQARTRIPPVAGSNNWAALRQKPT